MGKAERGMMEVEKKPRPNYLWSIITMRCPRCRRGDMFRNGNAFRKLTLRHIFDMHEKCPVCGQKFDLEPGFWYGTGYVSYALMVALSATTFVAWWVLIGISTDDNRIFYWLILNAVLIVVAEPIGEESIGDLQDQVGAVQRKRLDGPEPEVVGLIVHLRLQDRQNIVPQIVDNRVHKKITPLGKSSGRNSF